MQIERLVEEFSQPFESIKRFPESDVANDCLLRDFGDTLRIHHCFSKEPFTKDKFEFALERIANMCGHVATLAPKGNPGHDLTLNDANFSLKTQADKSIKRDSLHISKFMELGKGKWEDSVEDLIGLRNQFFSHMKSYDRILSLRCLSKGPGPWEYELVEIPKSLLEEAQHGELRIQEKSKQRLSKPGYCDVYAEGRKLKFQLYFDGGGERKLQIKKLLKVYCIVHANWKFTITRE